MDRWKLAASPAKKQTNISLKHETRWRRVSFAFYDRPLLRVDGPESISVATYLEHLPLCIRGPADRPVPILSGQIALV